MLRVGTCAAALAATLLWSAAVPAKENKQKQIDNAQFTGAIGCRSSSCHGGAGPKRDQYTIWSRQDFHTRSFAILTSARSARIAETVGGGEASTNLRCTICHSPFQTVASERLASTAHTDEGVSCESCHGAAEPWLRGHTRADWTYAMRVTAGMRDLRSLYVRANTCVACHQNIDNDLLKAGHPTMIFELDSQSINEPKHWQDEDPWIGPRAWLTGQSVALREAAWKSRTNASPSDDAQQTSLALAWLLAKVTTVESTLPKIFEPNTSDPGTLEKQADQLARAAALWIPKVDQVMSMLRVLAETDSEFDRARASGQTLLYRARRLVLALDRLSAAMNQNEASLKIDNDMNRLREHVRGSDVYDPRKFAEDLRSFRKQL